MYTRPSIYIHVYRWLELDTVYGGGATAARAWDPTSTRIADPINKQVGRFFAVQFSVFRSPIDISNEFYCCI